MDYIIYDENKEATVIETRKEEELTGKSESRLEQYKAALKETARN